jgi:hypothetical protein
VPRGELQQSRLRAPANTDVDGGREPIDSLRDHPRLLRTQLTRRERRGDRRVLLECPAERQVASRLVLGHPRLYGQPRRRVAQTVLLAHVVRGGQHPSRQCVELRTGLGQRHQRRLLLPHRHEGRLDRRDALERSLEVSGTPDDGMHGTTSSHALTGHRPGSGAER